MKIDHHRPRDSSIDRQASPDNGEKAMSQRLKPQSTDTQRNLSFYFWNSNQHLIFFLILFALLTFSLASKYRLRADEGRSGPRFGNNYSSSAKQTPPRPDAEPIVRPGAEPIVRPAISSASADASPDIPQITRGSDSSKKASEAFSSETNTAGIRSGGQIGRSSLGSFPAPESRSLETNNGVFQPKDARKRGIEPQLKDLDTSIALPFETASPNSDARAMPLDGQIRGPTSNNTQTSSPQAIALLQRVLSELVHGPAFHCKVRETVWTNGREVVGVGTYEQAGQGSGRYHLQVTMHDGIGKHRLQQISDGRLAWTRMEIAKQVTLRRVDVGRLDEWVGTESSRSSVAPRFTVGAWTELLSSVERDYVINLAGAKLENESVWVIKGKLSNARRAEIMEKNGHTSWPVLYPTRVHVAVQTKSDDQARFGQLLPVRFEFWSDPLEEKTQAMASQDAMPTEQDGARLITLIELYSIQPIVPPPVERFRFENQEAEVNFINETDRYIQMHGVQLTERELIQLRR